MPHLDGLHRVVLVQLVDVVGDAGVERGGGDGVDDGGVVGLLLVPLAVCVDEEREQAAQDGAAQPHGHHVEHVELWGESIAGRCSQGARPPEARARPTSRVTAPAPGTARPPRGFSPAGTAGFMSPSMRYSQSFGSHLDTLAEALVCLFLI